MTTIACDAHDWQTCGTIKRKLTIQDIHISHEITAYQRKEKHFSIKVDVLGAETPIKGVNMESTSTKESERKQTTKIDVGKIEGDELTLNLLFCANCEKELPPRSRQTELLQMNEKDLMSGIKNLYLTP